MPSCAVAGCNSHNRMNKGTGADTKFYTFPKNKDLALQWAHACNRGDKINMKNAAICSKHFESKCFFTSLKYKLLNETQPKRFRNLQCDALPTLFLSNNKSSSYTVGSSLRYQGMQAKNDEASNIPSPSQTKQSRAVVEQQIVNQSSTNNINELLKEMENLKTKILTLETAVKFLKSENEKLTNNKIASDAKLLSMNAALRNHFTTGQVKRILNPNKKYSHRASEDIASAILLRSVSSKAYGYLRKK